MREIGDDDLTTADIPGPDADWDAIGAFALTFDGYAASGSFDECATIANERRRRTLTEMRACLYFEQRRWRHFGDAPGEEAMRDIRGLLAAIRAEVARRGR